MDSADYYPDIKALKAFSKYKWYLSNLFTYIKLNLFVKINLQQCLDKPFSEPKPNIFER